jgi:hypothetical protein
MFACKQHDVRRTLVSASLTAHAIHGAISVFVIVFEAASETFKAY